MKNSIKGYEPVPKLDMPDAKDLEKENKKKAGDFSKSVGWDDNYAKDLNGADKDFKKAKTGQFNLLDDPFKMDNGKEKEKDLMKMAGINDFGYNPEKSDKKKDKSKKDNDSSKKHDAAPMISSKPIGALDDVPSYTLARDPSNAYQDDVNEYKKKEPKQANWLGSAKANNPPKSQLVKEYRTYKGHDRDIDDDRHLESPMRFRDGCKFHDHDEFP